MNYYSERNNLRKEVVPTYEISIKAYSVLYDKCEGYFDYISYLFPDYCQDGNYIIGLDFVKFSDKMEYEIPGLFRNSNDIVSRPDKVGYRDEFDTFAILDLIEYLYANMRDIARKDWHSFFKHDHIFFDEANYIINDFGEELNELFKKMGLSFQLSYSGLVERKLSESVISGESIEITEQFSEEGVKSLVKEAVALYKSPRDSNHNHSVEKIWDAFERIKTYYTNLNKKTSTEKICKEASLHNSDFEKLINDEFLELTKIGNEFRIRHHEMDRKEIQDFRHIDYLFNRCYSLVIMVMQFLET